MIIVHVDTMVVPEKEDDYVAGMKALMTASQAETGNITYNFSKHMGEDYRYLVTEVWESLDAFEYHESTEHFRKFMKDSMENKYAQRPPRIIKYEGDIFTG